MTDAVQIMFFSASSSLRATIRDKSFTTIKGYLYTKQTRSRKIGSSYTKSRMAYYIRTYFKIIAVYRTHPTEKFFHISLTLKAASRIQSYNHGAMLLFRARHFGPLTWCTTLLSTTFVVEYATSASGHAPVVIKLPRSYYSIFFKKRSFMFCLNNEGSIY